MRFMIMAAHQPQYLPWLGYFNKMAHCDVFIYLDDVQYKKREFQNRNRVRVKDSWQWLTVPVITKDRYTQEIRQVELNTDIAWGKDHWLALKLAYAKAPFFKDHQETLEHFYTQSWKKLGEMNEACVGWQLAPLGIQTPIRHSSEFAIKTSKSQRLLELCQAVGADTYLSGQGAKSYLDEELFKKEGVKVIYQNFCHPEYKQAYPGFEPYMAAADLIFNKGPESADLLKGS